MTAAQTTRLSASAEPLPHQEPPAALECAVEPATAASAMICKNELAAFGKYTGERQVQLLMNPCGCSAGAHPSAIAAQTTRPSASVESLPPQEAPAASERAVELATAASVMNCENEFAKYQIMRASSKLNCPSCAIVLQMHILWRLLPRLRGHLPRRNPYPTCRRQLCRSVRWSWRRLLLR